MNNSLFQFHVEKPLINGICKIEDKHLLIGFRLGYTGNEANAYISVEGVQQLFTPPFTQQVNSHDIACAQLQAYGRPYDPSTFKSSMGYLIDSTLETDIANSNGCDFIKGLVFQVIR